MNFIVIHTNKISSWNSSEKADHIKFSINDRTKGIFFGNLKDKHYDVRKL